MKKLSGRRGDISLDTLRYGARIFLRGLAETSSHLFHSKNCTVDISLFSFKQQPTLVFAFTESDLHDWGTLKCKLGYFYFDIVWFLLQKDFVEVQDG